ncbi:hypothetical protein SAMN02910340_02370 [Methanosarcina thermophila]|jgi:hypothetical protein|uniref:DNA and RNA helicase n=1 Tax=Methanosarcina thermophila TaxID=2210 RepID=A0A1I7AUC0_METTE|nr:hypothetical protein [Methanosarcina thermophila]ALK04443.1 MAG: hypothetical protein AAY43_00435 [Methanosarcina sp. 795]SFT78519.1 hypothetical protein SAMN02910340_02370 [Methanosarcina thermophila]BAW28059.1 DNA and RNA helicase [Methanosarcina thermophila]HOA69926.1 hypothetical protein [Methanosarcina thermophila]HOQ66724.1 hypothetical protein [Methanosarcina thermophila]
MTEDKKHYQGQRGYKAKELCPLCGEILSVAYLRKTVDGKRAYVAVGLGCPSDSCKYIKKSNQD